MLVLLSAFSEPGGRSIILSGVLVLAESASKVSLDFKSERLPTPASAIRDQAAQISSHPHRKRGNLKPIIISTMPPWR